VAARLMPNLLDAMEQSGSPDEGQNGIPPGSNAPDRPDFHRGLGFDPRFARKGRDLNRFNERAAPNAAHVPTGEGNQAPPTRFGLSRVTRPRSPRLWV